MLHLVQCYEFDMISAPDIFNGIFAPHRGYKNYARNVILRESATEESL
jgi:hypothetical protein